MLHRVLLSFNYLGLWLSVYNDLIDIMVWSTRKKSHNHGGHCFYIVSMICQFEAFSRMLRHGGALNHEPGISCAGVG
jgi:hypothetical protein